jgi:hypothetical protein
MTLITLSSIPPRFGLIGPTLEALAAQSGVDGVELYLPQSYRRFPDWDGTLPKVPKGVTIHRCELDYGPATKVLCAVKRHRGENLRLLFCDDDRDYRPGWAKGLLDEADRYPDRAVALAGWDIAGLTTRDAFGDPRHERRSRTWDMAYRLARLKQLLSGQGKANLSQKPPRRIIAQAGYADVFEGYGGVVLRPDFIDDATFDIPPEAFHVDDVWLSGALARQGIGIWLAADLPEPKTTEADRHDALYRHRVAEKGRVELDAEAVQLLRTRFGIWGGPEAVIPDGGVRQI